MPPDATHSQQTPGFGALTPVHMATQEVIPVEYGPPLATIPDP